MTSEEQLQWMAEAPKDPSAWTTKQVLTLFEVCSARENSVVYDRAKGLMRMLMKSKRIDIGIRYERMTDEQINSSIDKTFDDPRVVNAFRTLFLGGEVVDGRVTPKNVVN